MEEFPKVFDEDFVNRWTLAVKSIGQRQCLPAKLVAEVHELIKEQRKEHKRQEVNFLLLLIIVLTPLSSIHRMS